MKALLGIVFFFFAISALASAAPRQHTITFGAWMPVKWFVGPAEDKAQDIKVRALYVDSKLREFTLGDPHDVTDHVFVVRRAYRVNDALPDDPKAAPKWQRQPARVTFEPIGTAPLSFEIHGSSAEVPVTDEPADTQEK